MVMYIANGRSEESHLTSQLNDEDTQKKCKLLLFCFFFSPNNGSNLASANSLNSGSLLEN